METCQFMVIKHQQKQKHYLLVASMVLTALYEVKETETSVFSKKTFILFQ